MAKRAKKISAAAAKANQRERNARNQAAWRRRQTRLLRGWKRKVAIAEKQLAEAMAKLADKEGKS
jgi:hypothetical protein